jgi:DNA repair photolyase
MTSNNNNTNNTNNANIYTAELSVNNQVYFCGVPFRLDSYSGCTHNCYYCFARTNQLTNISKEGRREDLMPADPMAFKNKLWTSLDTDRKREGIEFDWLRHRVPIHFGGMSDPFQPCEEKYKVTKKMLEYLSWYEYPTIISTKGTRLLLKDKDYLKLLKEGKYILQVTLIGKNKIVDEIEPGATPALERIEALKILADAGIHTVVRMQPVFPNSVLEDELPEFIETCAKAGIKHFITEGYKVQVRNEEWKRKLAELMPNVMNGYNGYSDSASFGFEMLLPSWRKYQYVKVAKKVCHENHITYGAADNDMRIFGDVVCCCGADNVKGFENFWRYQASQAIKIASEKEDHIVTHEDMKQYWNGGDGKIAEQAGEMRDYANSKGIKITAGFAVDWAWVHGGDTSPAVIVGSKPALDKKGNVAWRWDDPIKSLEEKNIEQGSLF